MLIGNWIHSYGDILLILAFIICVFMVLLMALIGSEKGIIVYFLSIITVLVITVVTSMVGAGYYENVSSDVKNAEKTLVSSKYAVVKPYKVKTYLLNDNKKKAEVVLTNGKKLENVEVKRITKLSNESKTRVSLYDINLKKKYQPLNNKNEFNRQTLVIEKKTKGSQVK